MSSRHERVLRDVFEEPTKANITWIEIEAMLRHYGAEVAERAGSRIVAKLGERRAHFHRPHPQKEAGRLLVRAVRDFCVQANLFPEDDP